MNRQDLEDQRLLGAFLVGTAVGIASAALLTTEHRRDIARVARQRLDRFIGGRAELPEGDDRG